MSNLLIRSTFRSLSTMIPKETYAYIGGKVTKPTFGRTFETINPATGEVLSTVYECGAADIDAAVASAQEGFAVWSAYSGTERARVLHRAVALLRERNDELAALEVLDCGKPIAEAKYVDVQSGSEALEYMASLAPSLAGEHVQLPNGNFAYTRREPLGICAGIGAWNYPLQIACWKAAPALACGNAMIYKPSEMTPLTAMRLAEIFTEAGLPDGVFNVVHGKGETGQLLSQHQHIDKVTFTGSVATGKRVYAAGATNVKHVTLELGGKSPLLIFDDADLEEAVKGAMMANFYTNGEICCNGTRVFVQEGIKDKLVERLVARSLKLRIGSPQDEDTDVGSLISKDHLLKVHGYVERAQKAGASLLCGGKPKTSGDFAKGCFYEPTIFDNVTDDMEVAQEEVFGPVMSLFSFKSEEEGIRRANSTHFGLAAGVFTRDVKRAHRIAAKLQAGTVWINNYNLSPIEVPFGGYKQSGLGRENGRTAIEHFSQLKTVYVEMNQVDCPYPE